MAAITSPVAMGGRGSSVNPPVVGTSGANAPQTIATAAAANVNRLNFVSCTYSAAPTEAGVTITIISASGSAYNIVINTFAANLQNNFYLPVMDLLILPGDTVSVTAPAGGAGVTSSIVIATESM